MDRDPPSKRLSGVYFSYYRPKQVAAVSVVKVHKFKAFDKHGRAIKGGLYDPAMGVSPTDRRSV